MALEAYAQFHGFDWLNNPDWLAYKAKLEIPAGAADALLSKRQRWFKAHIVRLLMHYASTFLYSFVL